jgi:hypothetical protein
MKFREGELIQMFRAGMKMTFQIRKGQEGEPRKHKFNTKTGKAQSYGSEVRVTEKFRRLSE